MPAKKRRRSCKKQKIDDLCEILDLPEKNGKKPIFKDERPSKDDDVIELPIGPILEILTESDEPKILQESNSNAAKSIKIDQPRITVIDDDLQIISCDEGKGCATITSVSTRNSEIRHCCKTCTRSFITDRALREHEFSHGCDAGATCEQTFAVPADVEVHACRVCCLAYERRDVFKAHVERHNRARGCALCTAISSNDAQLLAHKVAHSTVGLIFGCAECRVAYRSEATLLLHCNFYHGMKLLWLCTKCNRASTDFAWMFAHKALHHGRTPSLVPMPCPLNKMHFQPANPTDHEKMVESLPEEAKKLLTPAECPHRTFSSYSEVLLCCPSCGSMIPVEKFLLDSQKCTDEEDHFQLALLDEISELADYRKFHPAQHKPPTISL